MESPIKVRNFEIKVISVTEKSDKQGTFEILLCEDKNEKEYTIMLREGWTNYGKYKKDKVLYIKTARMIDNSPNPSILFFVRINHALTDDDKGDFS